MPRHVMRSGYRTLGSSNADKERAEGLTTTLWMLDLAVAFLTLFRPSRATFDLNFMRHWNFHAELFPYTVHY